MSKRVSDTQRKLLYEYQNRFGGVMFIQHKNKVQIMLETKMVQMEGLGIEWILRFNEEFKDVCIGIPQDTTTYGMYIQLEI